jgi:hypothetical protein
MKRKRLTKVGIILGIVGASYMAAGSLSWLENRRKCHGQCGHNNRDCQQVCLDKGYCPAEDRPQSE